MPFTILTTLSFNLLFSCQFRQRPERISHFLPFVQKLIQYLPVGRRCVMQKYDSSRMYPRRKLIKRLLMTWLLILIPVHISQTPEYGFIPQLVRHFQIICITLTLRRTIVGGKFRSCDLPEQIRHIVQFFPECLFIG